MTSQTVAGRDIDSQSAILHIDKLKWRPGVYGLILNEQGEVLVVQNTVNYLYELPGGGVEIHETFSEAVIREVWEETGFHVEIDGLITMIDEFFLTPSGKHWHVIMSYYRCRIVGGELRETILEGEAIENSQWIDPKLLTEDNLIVGWQALQKTMK